MDSPPAKRGRPRLISVLSRYPPLSRDEDSDDDIAMERHMGMLKKEMERESPRKEQLLQLMKVTYTIRREFVLSDSSEVSATAVLEKYPALSLVSVVSSYAPLFAPPRIYGI